MKQIVFYSWQSDLPNACNRGFIQGALENAAAADTVRVLNSLFQQAAAAEGETRSGFLAWRTSPLEMSVRGDI